MNTNWYIKETSCWPAKWKVTFDWQGQDFGSNATLNYFRDKEEAQREVDRRNKKTKEN